MLRGWTAAAGDGGVTFRVKRRLAPIPSPGPRRGLCSRRAAAGDPQLRFARRARLRRARHCTPGSGTPERLARCVCRAGGASDSGGGAGGNPVIGRLTASRRPRAALDRMERARGTSGPEGSARERGALTPCTQHRARRDGLTRTATWRGLPVSRGTCCVVRTVGGWGPDGRVRFAGSTRSAALSHDHLHALARFTWNNTSTGVPNRELSLEPWWGRLRPTMLGVGGEPAAR